MRKFRIVVLGCGNVGATFCKLVRRKEFSAIEIYKIVVQNLSKPRNAEVGGTSEPVTFSSDMLTTDASNVVTDPNVDIVVDATAGETTGLLLKALSARKHVVTANKKFVASDGAKLKAAAAAAGVCFQYEATVMAKIPVLNMAQCVRPLCAQRFDAIVSGTCAFVMRQMRTAGMTFDNALKLARDKGFAEADPTVDIDAYDAVAKACILAHEFLGAKSLVPEARSFVLREGIRGLPDVVHRFAAAMGRVVELVASGIRDGNNIGVLVIPTLVERNFFLGGLQGVENGLVVEDLVGPPLEFAGPGAGGLATAAALVMDVMRIVDGQRRSPNDVTDVGLPLLPPENIRFRPVFVSASPENQPAVLAAKLDTLAKAGLSIEQLGNDAAGTWIDEEGDTVSYDAIACTSADYSVIANAREALAKLPCVKNKKVFLLRILGDAPLSYVGH